jgi:hypothetical protein
VAGSELRESSSGRKLEGTPHGTKHENTTLRPFCTTLTAVTTYHYHYYLLPLITARSSRVCECVFALVMSMIVFAVCTLHTCESL